MSYSRRDVEQIIGQYRKSNSKQKSTSAFSPKSQLNRSNSPKDLTLRYKQLYSKYVGLLQSAKDREQLVQLQENELVRLRSERQRDQKELYRLRSMIGFMKKDDKGIQVSIDMQSVASIKERQTTVQCNQDLDLSRLEKWYVPQKLNQKKSPTNRQIVNQSFNFTQNALKTAKVFDMYQKLNNCNNVKEITSQRGKAESFYSPKSEQEIKNLCSQKSNNKLSNSPYAKLKFSRNIHIN